MNARSSTLASGPIISVAISLFFAATAERLFAVGPVDTGEMAWFRATAFGFMAAVELLSGYWSRRKFTRPWALYYIILCMFCEPLFVHRDAPVPLAVLGLEVFATSFLILALLTTLAYLAKRDAERDPWTGWNRSGGTR